ncbi:MAG: AraC family transcriptional regulator [Eubacteriales bacterium]
MQAQFYEQYLSPPFEDSGLHFSVELKILRILRGGSEFFVGGKSHTLKSGDIVILNPLEPRAFTQIDRYDYPFHFEQIVFLPMYIYPYLDALTCFWKRGSGVSVVISSTSPHHAEASALYGRISEAARNGVSTPLERSFMRCAIQLLVILVAKHYDLPGERDNSPSRHDIKRYRMFADAVSYIHENSAEDMSEDMLAREACVSKYEFSRMFRTYSGMSLPEYLRRLRIINTVELLRKESVGIMDAAFRSGFNSSSGFYKAFVSVTGKTPKEYMRVYRNTP